MTDDILFAFHICLLVFLSTKATSQTAGDISAQEQFTYEHPIIFAPERYVCYKSDTPIVIDGVITSTEWGSIPWTNSFVDIQGNLKPSPSLDTKAKMTWDDTYLYIAALIEEPHIWATLTERDAIMYHDDDFEVFIDPDGDGHNYFEFEMNAFNAIWDLYMLYPYYIDDGRNYIMNWDIRGIKTAVHMDGSINDPSDIDDYWSIEIAVPWKTFSDFKTGDGRPQAGEKWRMNFSRVDWTMGINDGKYVKEKRKDSDRPLPENNWVWSPTGYINMHKPETWGYVQFESDRSKRYSEDKGELIKWALWQLYYQLKECHKAGRVVCTLVEVTVPEVLIPNYKFDPELSSDSSGFTLTASSLDDRQYVINEMGKIVKREN